MPTPCLLCCGRVLSPTFGRRLIVEFRRIFSLGAGLLVGGLAAQTAPTPRSEATGERVVELSAFEVRSDRALGYRAASSVTATGIGTEIANIPINVGVVTADFIADFGGTELIEATKGISGFNSDPLNSNRAWLRGFESSRILQDGFEVGAGLMTDGLERIEVIKGPSAIFHGEVNPAGVVNLISARPAWRQQSEVRLSYGSEDYRKVYVQNSGPLVEDKLAYLLFGSFLDTNGWDDHTMRQIKIGGAALTWRPVDKLKLTLDVRHVDRTEIQPALLPFTHPAFLAAVRNGQVAPRTTARSWLNNNPAYGPTEPQSQILVADELFAARESNPANGNYPQTNERTTVFGEAIYEINEAATLRIVAAQTDTETVGGFYTSFRPVAGFNRDLIFGVAEHRFNYGRNEQERAGLKADLRYTAEWLGTKHDLLVGYEYNQREVGSTSINAGAIVWKPLVDAERDALAELAAARPNGFPPITNTSRLEANSIYLVDQITFPGERWRLLAGLRHMEIEVTSAAGVANTQEETTPQVGLHFRPTRDVAFYANFSRSFESQLVVDALGNVSEPITGEGMEAGVKIDWMDGKLSGTAGIYQIERANIARRDTPRERELNIEPLWVLGGLQRSEGLDVDFTYTPRRNLQFVLAYAHMWRAETVSDPQTPQQVGVRLRHTPEHALSLFGKYSFTEGPLAGFYVGGSVQYRSSFRWHDSWDVTHEITNYRPVNLLMGYRKMLAGGREWSIALNVDNVLNDERLDMQFFWADPISWRLSTRLMF